MRCRVGSTLVLAWFSRTRSGRRHAAAIAKTPGAELAAIAAASEASCAAAREAYPEAEVYSDYKALLERGDLEAVDVVAPTYLHFEMASAALRAGKHLLPEKPMAPTLPQCDELVGLAREHQRLFAVGHEFRLSSLWGRLKEMIDEGFIGRPQYALIALSRRPYRLGSNNWPDIA
jgi:myo-inositol 2-dehydrogenase/D-chiro-inositol 1-dehydrogenase